MRAIRVRRHGGPEEVRRGLEAGILRPVVAAALPLADAPRAHERILAPGALGKIVLVPGLSSPASGG